MQKMQEQFSADLQGGRKCRKCRSNFQPTYKEVGSADIASLHGKDCSYNPIAFPPSMEVRCNLVGQRICPWLKIAPCIFHTSHIHVGRMDGSRTTHMYRTYGSRVTHGAATEERLSRSNYRGAKNLPCGIRSQATDPIPCL